MYNRHTKPTHWLVCYVCVLVSQSCLTLCNPMYCSLPGKNTRVDYHFLLHGIFPTQGLNTSLLHCRQILYHLSHQGSLILSEREYFLSQQCHTSCISATLYNTIIQFLSSFCIKAVLCQYQCFFGFFLWHGLALTCLYTWVFKVESVKIVHLQFQMLSLQLDVSSNINDYSKCHVKKFYYYHIAKG